MKRQKKPRFPIREYLGKYESWLLTLYGSNTFWIQDQHIEKFLEMFPGRAGWEEFSAVDIADYRKLRQDAGASKINLNYELGTLRSLWKWLREHAGMNTVKFTKVFGINWEGILRTPKRAPITLIQIERLLEACPSDKHRRIVLTLMLGGKNPRGIRGWSKVKAIARELGFENFGSRALRARARGLSRDIVEAYCNQRLNALAPETKPQRDTLTTIQFSSSDERASILDSDDSTSPGSRIEKI